MITAEQLMKANENLSSLSIKGKDYVQVTERVKAFRSLCPNGTISTEIISLDGEQVVMKATVKDGDTILGTGLAYEKESSSYINKTSYIENCETSAVGRALGFCGIGIDASMCSAEELVNAISQQAEMKDKEKQRTVARTKIDPVKVSAILKKCTDDHIDINRLAEHYKIRSLGDLNEEQHSHMLNHWEQVKEAYGDNR